MTSAHHFLVHFPVALLLVAALADLVGVSLKQKFFTQVAFLLLVLGALGGIAAAVSGNAAEAGLLGTAPVAEAVQDELTAHTRVGNVMIWMILAVVGGRGFAFLERNPWATRGLLFPILTTLLALAVVYTGLLGGRLSGAVYAFLIDLL